MAPCDPIESNAFDLLIRQSLWCLRRRFDRASICKSASWHKSMDWVAESNSAVAPITNETIRLERILTDSEIKLLGLQSSRSQTVRHLTIRVGSKVGGNCYSGLYFG